MRVGSLWDVLIVGCRQLLDESCEQIGHALHHFGCGQKSVGCPDEAERNCLVARFGEMAGCRQLVP